MTKYKDRRISAYQKVKLDRKTRDKYKKIEKIKAKKGIRNLKAPKSVYLTDEDVQKIKEIKEQTKKRTIEFNSMNKEDVAPYIKELNEAIETSDLFIEIVDYRDISGSRCKKAEDFLKEKGKQVYVFVSFYSDEFSVNFDEIENCGLKVIRDVSVFTDKKNVCIFGRPQSGKFTFSKQIEEIIKEVSIRIIKVPAKLNGASDVLRSAVNQDSVDFFSIFRKLYNYIDPLSIRDFYRIPNFETCDELCFLIGSKYSNIAQNKKCKEVGALQFLKDVKNYKIMWIKHGDSYTFKFKN